MKRRIIFFWILIQTIGSLVFYTNARVSFTNVICTSLDKKFADFEYCYLKSFNRSFKYLSLRVNLFEKPVTRVSARWTLLKRANGYKPFLYNITFSGCDFLRGKRRNPVVTYFYGWFKKYSNLNHSCPLTEDIIVEKLDTSHLDHSMTSILPMPRGEYCFDTDWFAFGIKRASVKVFLELT